MKRNYTNSKADQWYLDVINDASKLPFFFTYDGKKYGGFDAAHFQLKDSKISRIGDKETRTLVWHLENALEATLLITHYYSHGATEWTVWFENVSDTNSGILENVRTEMTFTGKYPCVKGILGDHINQYRPYAFDPSGNVLEFSSLTGQTTHNNFPYFNLEYGDEGVMLVIGWAGTWNARFRSDGEKTVYTAEAVNGMRLYLKPHEKIRTALFVVAPYTKRNEYFATNYWRSWFVEYNLPKEDVTGKDVQPFSTVNFALDTGLPHSDGSISECHTTWRPSMQKTLDEGLLFDFRWLDAGWYVAPDGGSAEPRVAGHDWWDTVGTWEPDPVKWPGKSLLESTDFARENGMRTLVWFEPERVTDVENLAKKYGYNPEWAIQLEGRRGICNNIGDPDCLAWTTERICKMLRENKVEMYREDNNFKPAYLWEYLDAKEGKNRKGITEIKNITAHYKLWDDIIACTLSYGGCGFVDSCASGGGRNDLESLRRAIPLLRSDSDRKAIAHRLSMSSSFNKWIPFNGACSIADNPTNNPWAMGKTDVYSVRASYLPSLHITAFKPVQDPDTDFDIYRFALAEWRRVCPYLLKEFYVLTPWHKEIDYSKHGEIDTTFYTVFCYFDPETEKGVVLAFREQECSKDYYALSLPFAKAGEKYRLKDEDSGEEIIVDGVTELHFPEPRTSRLLWLEKL